MPGQHFHHILAEAKQKLEAMGSKYLTSYPIRLALDIITNTNAPKLKMELKKIEKELDNEL